MDWTLALCTISILYVYSFLFYIGEVYTGSLVGGASGYHGDADAWILGTNGSNCECSSKL